MLHNEIDIGPIRPPSEGGSHSLLIRASRNCPWNRCTFCYGLSYNREKFQVRSVDDIKKDIDRVAEVKRQIEKAAANGNDGKINHDLFREMNRRQEDWTSGHTFTSVYSWLMTGGKTVFLQDADSLVMKTDQLIDILTYIKASFPSVERITSYARGKSALHKKMDELIALKKAGLSRLHIGVETGDEELLKKVKKGITQDEHIRAGKKVVHSGIELSTYVMPGLGGLYRSIEHAQQTAYVLNEVNPRYIRLRPFVPRHGTPMFDDYQEKRMTLLSPHGVLTEIGMLIDHLNVTSRLCFDHAMNPSYRSGLGVVPLFSQSYEGYQLPEQKNELIEQVNKGLAIDETAFIRSEDLMNAML